MNTWYEWLAEKLKARRNAKGEHTRYRMIPRTTKNGSHVKACGTQYRGCAPECTFNVEPREEDYLGRHYILSTPWVGVYLHRLWSDDDDGLHDHPWNSVSILLSGSYVEEMPERQTVPHGPTIKKIRYPGHPFFFVRSRYDAHRLTALRHEDCTSEAEHWLVGKPIWSLFIRFGLKRRTWGFYSNGGWKPAEFQSRKELTKT